MTFKFVKTEAKIVRRVLGAHGFKEVNNMLCIMIMFKAIFELAQHALF